MRTITKTQVFPSASIDVQRRDDKYVVVKRYGAFGNYDVREFDNPDDALHAASELASAKSVAMNKLYRALEDANDKD